MATNGSVAASPDFRGRALTPEEFIVFNDELRSLARAGIPLEIGLGSLKDRSGTAVRHLSERIGDRLASGMPLEKALASEEGNLPVAYGAVLQAGLRTGRLDEVLRTLSEIAESFSAMRQQLRLAMIYPAILLVLVYLLFLVYVVFLVPQLERTYVLFELQESSLVEGLLWIHRSVSTWGIAVPVAVMAAIVVGAVLQRVRGDAGVLQISRWLPGANAMSFAKFSRVLALLVDHQVPLPEACRLSGRAAADGRIERAADRIAQSVEEGHSLEKALQHERVFPAFLRWLAILGERQQSLGASLRQAADVYEQRALSRLEWFHRFVPPAIVVVGGGGLTLLYALTLFLPLRDTLNRLGQG